MNVDDSAISAAVGPDSPEVLGAPSNQVRSSSAPAVASSANALSFQASPSVKGKLPAGLQFCRFYDSGSARKRTRHNSLPPNFSTRSLSLFHSDELKSERPDFLNLPEDKDVLERVEREASHEVISLQHVIDLRVQMHALATAQLKDVAERLKKFTT